MDAGIGGWIGTLPPIGLLTRSTHLRIVRYLALLAQAALTETPIRAVSTLGGEFTPQPRIKHRNNPDALGHMIQCNG